MRTPNVLPMLIAEIKSQPPSLELAARLLAIVLDFMPEDVWIWLEEFGNPLVSLAAAKELCDLLGLDWNRAMEAGGLALQANALAPLQSAALAAVIWMLSACQYDETDIMSPNLH